MWFKNVFFSFKLKIADIYIFYIKNYISAIGLINNYEIFADLLNITL